MVIWLPLLPLHTSIKFKSILQQERNQSCLRRVRWWKFSRKFWVRTIFYCSTNFALVVIQTVKSHGDGPVCQKTVKNHNVTNHAYAMVHGALIMITKMETGMILLIFILLFSCNKHCRVEPGYRCLASLMSDSDAVISTFSCISTSSTTT
jgi:hypothetical protein